MMEVVDEEVLPYLRKGMKWIPVHPGESGDRGYRCSNGFMHAKVSTGVGIAVLDEERQRTEWLAETGFSCPKVLDWIVAEDIACQITETLPGFL